MNEFRAVALFLALAVAGLAVALAFVLPHLMRSRAAAPDPTVRRDLNLAVYREQLKDLKAERSGAGLSDEEFEATRRELEIRAAEDALSPADGAPPAPAPGPSRRLGVALAALLPVAAFGLYFWLGNPAVLTAIAANPGGARAAAEPGPEEILGMIGKIEARTQTHPDDGAAWEALAMANVLAARWPEALQAYEQAHRLLPEKPSVLVGYAESLAMNANQVLAGRPIELVNQALRLDPAHTKGLELAVVHAYQTGNYARALEFIERLGQQAAPDTAYGREVMAMREDAQRRLQAGGAAAAGAAPAVPAPAAASAAKAAAPAGSVAGRVDVAEALKPRIGPQATVFVVARAAQGGPPLAAARLPLAAWPLSFRLDDSMAMIPGNLLSGHRAVLLVARVSASGNPIAQPGDLEGRLEGVAVGSDGVRLLIDRVLP
ncbi:MAG: c-type cytochrome biogenesis protein CcmI [Burkholderiaceae bacterium]|jgi:cytochrome c-type biogenesis protein CcmH|nr:c-type cytochrome biogenesis protein CcmI [Burkholderiaceae bacterium]